MTIRPLVHSGDSANMASYGERGRVPSESYVWCQVICAALTRRDGEWVPLHPNEYSFTVYRNKKGQLGTFRYVPRTRSTRGTLPDRTVTRLVREWLEANA